MARPLTLVLMGSSFSLSLMEGRGGGDSEVQRAKGLILAFHIVYKETIYFVLSIFLILNTEKNYFHLRCAIFFITAILKL